MPATEAKSTPSRIIAEICNRRRNSDVRADDLEIRHALDKAFEAERQISRLLADMLQAARLECDDPTRRKIDAVIEKYEGVA